MEEDGKNPHQGGGGAAGVQVFLKIHDIGGVALCIGDLGGQPLNGKIPWRVQDQVA